MILILTRGARWALGACRSAVVAPRTSPRGFIRDRLVGLDDLRALDSRAGARTCDLLLVRASTTATGGPGGWATSLAAIHPR